MEWVETREDGSRPGGVMLQVLMARAPWAVSSPGWNTAITVPRQASAGFVTLPDIEGLLKLMAL